MTNETTNISRKGLLKFGQSKGIGKEAMIQEPSKEVVILKIDSMKLGLRNVGGIENR